MVDENKFKDIEMKIEVTNICQWGRCKFCSPMFRPTVREEGEDIFLKRMSENLDIFLDNSGRKIILTGGGEPIDAPAKLYSCIELINKKVRQKKIKLELFTLYSNGVSLLKPLEEGKKETHLDKLCKEGITDIDISLSGSTQKERVAVSGEYMGKINYEKLFSEIKKKKIRIMTRTTLTKGAVDSVKKIKKMIRWLASLGVEIIYFSDLFKLAVVNKETVTGSKATFDWCEKHRVNFSKLLEKMKQDKDFEFVSASTRHAEQGNTYEFKLKGIRSRVLLGNLIIGNEKTNAPTYAYVKPDGTMWTDNNKRKNTRREFVSLSEIKKYRPGRSDWK